MRRWLVVVGVLVVAVLAGCGDDAVSGDGLAGNGEVVTETTTVPEFSRLRIDNGIAMTLDIDEEATGEVQVAVTTDSNLIEFVSVSEAGGTLTVSASRSGGLHPTEGIDVTATVAEIAEANVDNGSSLTADGPLKQADVSVANGSAAEVSGTAQSVSLAATSGSSVDAGGLKAATADVVSSNGSSMTVCASVNVSGEVNYGSNLTVRCGADTRSVTTSVGSSISVEP